MHETSAHSHLPSSHTLCQTRISFPCLPACLVLCLSCLSLTSMWCMRWRGCSLLLSLFFIRRRLGVGIMCKFGGGLLPHFDCIFFCLRISWHACLIVRLFEHGNVYEREGLYSCLDRREISWKGLLYVCERVYVCRGMNQRIQRAFVMSG